MIANVKSFIQDEEGQSMVEYGVTLGAIAAVSYIAVVSLGDRTADLYAWMANHLPGGEADEVGTDNLVRFVEDGLVSLSDTATGLVFDNDEMLQQDMGDTLAGSDAILNQVEP
ncbi:hypothetical protein ED236_10690 [Pseudomethylobacillus aquaticus]|uniref:Flp family type IVb pilin n=1 Tax=Pseudomethylobacillus aquaticus TaxID=2676064 RepID=A0A3N0UYG7_9PROT|nr:hypothetical protein [Pseudomethylobacillus aquaticus]ROH85314.1 hypothetical protein ED236_10690 [Pseudomethylobacillus aquaticus]